MLSKVSIIILGFLVLGFLSSGKLQAETQANLVTNYFSKLDYKDYSQQMDLSNYFVAQAESLPKALGESKDIYQFKTKSAKKAFLYSLVVPGAGQYYLGSRIKPIVYLGLEAAFWVGYFSYHNKGEDKEKAYKVFADLYWNPSKYIDSLIVNFRQHCDTAQYCDSLDAVTTLQDSVFAMEESLGFSHHLQFSNNQINRNQQYYENLGKYEQFRYGWSDYDPLADPLTPNRSSYLSQRRKANDLYGKATTFAMVSLANHVLSAFEAAISTRSYNRKGEKFSQASLKMRLATDEEGNLIPKATVTIKF
ncbi:MAG: hypothetical protein A2145_07090 [candidate division Zixibacteria bacterium RBG_16_40_9]|nr:MAG: hypothetical protein A2145_07090 [candidate division Zixibacteria bacterium RBG_16_40_9]